MALSSALYHGTLTHRRHLPRRHEFSYRLFMLYLDLDELDHVFAGRWLWSVERPNLVSFRRADHLGPPERPLADAVRDLVAERTGTRPSGPIRLLTHPRYFGYVFNPLSVYYCFDRDDRRLEAIVNEVSNTPWNERHWYVLPVDATDTGRLHRFQLTKEFHVSPFMTMDHDYDWRFSDPSERLSIHMRNACGGAHHFDATLHLDREPINAATCARRLARQPFMTGRVVGAIYWQALRLWLKGIPFQPHPRTHAGANSPAEPSQPGARRS